MTTLRVALDASQMLTLSRQVAAALQQMGDGAKKTGDAVEGLEREFVVAARGMDTTRESLKATSGAIQAAGNVRSLVESLKEVDGSFASIANVAANAAQTLLSFGRAAEDFSQLKDASQQVTNAMAAQTAATVATGTATGTAATATTVWTRATLALRAAWAAHPVLLIGSILAAAATAMAAFSSSTKNATQDTAALAEQQKALEQSLKNVQRIQAEGRLGAQFGIAGAAEQARQREQQAVFQQAVDVETQRMRGGGGVRAADLAAGRQVEEILNAQQTVRFQREVQATLDARRRALLSGGAGTGGGAVIELQAPETMTAKQRASFEALRRQVTEEVASGFTIGYDEAIRVLQGRFGELAAPMQQAAQQGPSGVAYGISGSMGRLQAQIDAEVRRQQVIGQINSGLAEEFRLAGLTETARERELAILRIKQEALQAGVELTDTELANIEKTLSAQQRLTAAQRAAEYDRSTREGYADRQRLAGMGDEQRRIEEAVAAQRAQAEQEGIPFTAERERFVREQEMATANIEQLRATGEAVGAAIGNSFASAATGVATLRQALAGLLQDLLRIAAQQAIIRPLTNALGNVFAGPSGMNPTSGQVTFDTGANAGSYAGTLEP